MFLRTSTRRMSAECAAQVRQADPGRLAPRRAGRHGLYLHGATVEDSIPQENREAWNRGRCGVVLMEVRDRPAGGAWEGHLDWGILGSCFRSSAAIRRAPDAEMEIYRRDETPSGTGVFRAAPDGGMTFEKTFRQNGRTLLRVRGERVSMRTQAY